jgi:hypothetical protein
MIKFNNTTFWFYICASIVGSYVVILYIKLNDDLKAASKKKQYHVQCYSGGKKVIDEYSLDVKLYGVITEMKDLGLKTTADCTVED